jgi:hypothetical protein
MMSGRKSNGGGGPGRSRTVGGVAQGRWSGRNRPWRPRKRRFLDGGPAGRRDADSAGNQRRPAPADARIAPKSREKGCPRKGGSAPSGAAFRAKKIWSVVAPGPKKRRGPCGPRSTTVGCGPCGPRCAISLTCQRSVTRQLRSGMTAASVPRACSPSRVFDPPRRATLLSIVSGVTELYRVGGSRLRCRKVYVSHFSPSPPPGLGTRPTGRIRVTTDRLWIKPGLSNRRPVSQTPVAAWQPVRGEPGAGQNPAGALAGLARGGGRPQAPAAARCEETAGRNRGPERAHRRKMMEKRRPRK